ncbi:URC4/urg3 family protein [Belnapia sp. T6]|uniref:URC4/urg3 family protein n=1 Tax=Belnapia mucosa TaxID=2804532 RepID=A0ABS1V2R6_9PROT|nr:URC4/urg3 family protein [Belnapia mucosa]
MNRPRPSLDLLTPEAVRERCGALFAHAQQGRLEGWQLDLDRLPATADLVAQVVRENYPDLAVPFHARWRHFAVGGVDRWAALPARDPRMAFDLAITSVLLDAGAGMGWRYREAETGQVFARSEGLAVASFRMFTGGAFAADGRSPRADAARLATLTEADLAAGFQAGPDNPLIGLEGRAALLRRLGEAVPGRPGALFDHLAAQAEGGTLPARAILIALLHHLGPVWPNGPDIWPHPGITAPDGFVPFHKLSQWLAYSLIEPIEESGIRVTDIDALTGLPEYRNGGLFLDLGVIRLMDPADAGREHAPGSPLIVGWRALTVALLDRIAPLVRKRLGVTAEAFPLARVLEGGTWWAGRRLAAERRADGGPPLRIASDGTLF